jgi:hypothetical protein
MSKQTAQEEVQVSVSDSYLPEFAQVVDRLRKAGLHVDQQLQAVGVVTGYVEPGRIDGLAQVAGVANIERSRIVRIPPGELSH